MYLNIVFILFILLIYNGISEFTSNMPRTVVRIYIKQLTFRSKTPDSVGGSQGVESGGSCQIPVSTKPTI